jgi:hypothetical protein
MALKAVELNPGECIVLPAGATITGIIVNGDASVTSTCGDLPDPEDYVCGYFEFQIDKDGNSNHANNEYSTYITSIKVGETTYVINQLATTATMENINIHITDLGIFKVNAPVQEFEVDDEEAEDKRWIVQVFFQVAESLFDTLQMLVTSHVGHPFPSPQIYLPIETSCIT